MSDGVQRAPGKAVRLSAGEDDCTCDREYGRRRDNPGCPYRHPRKKPLQLNSLTR